MLGPIPIQVWGLFVALGIILATLILYKRAKKFYTNPDQLLDLSIYFIVGGLVGARIFHIVFYELAFFIDNPIEIIKIWHGGMSSFGGFVGAGIGFLWFVKKNRINKEKFLSIADQLGFASLYGWIVGRLGCASIHDHAGRLSNNFLAVKFPEGARFDMAIIEIIFLLPLAILFLILHEKKLFPGFYLATILVYYGFLRFVLDFFRAIDISHADVRYVGLTPGQYFGIVMFGLGVWLFVKKSIK
ncbi:prolipoprotein diacylglyceryl transferase [Patescibacteria group bacterium]|nr:prolipoprotein diacylglyceryl transferase [Patescibacteria group bacterium]MBU1895737.1 prolipoprotein diacylglyceryl transferase [Patescibacteria group bacterium]